MIYLDRKRIAPPYVLVSEDGLGQKERRKARDHYSKSILPKQTYRKFSAYKHDSVRKALQELCPNKCAYCESYTNAIGPVDVEHYRPKGQIEGADHPGYWWLASNWENLLPSCIDCNRRRRQVIISKEKSYIELEELYLLGKQELSGKKDSFPTLDDFWVREEFGDLDTETPLLLDPSKIDPCKHLEWVFEGQLSLVAPKITNGIEDKIGAISIHIYGLNRIGLVDLRTRLLFDLKQLLFDIVNGFETLSILVGTGREFEIACQLGRKIDHLYSKSLNNEAYSSMAKAYIKKNENLLKDAKLAVKLVNKYNN